MTKLTDKDHEAILTNRATAPEAQTHECDQSDYGLIFALQVGKERISLDMPTILSCLRLAEKEGYTPELPHEWWMSLKRFYRTPFE